MKVFVVSIITSSVLFAGCGSASDANSNAAANNSGISNTRLQNVDPKDLPPGLSASPLAPAANGAPGPGPINAANGNVKGASTPGLPDPANVAKPAKPGDPRPEGIPDDATMKKQMEEIRKRLNSNSNQPQPPPPPGASDGQMMRKQRKIANANN